jgi:hypothetical protein
MSLFLKLKDQCGKQWGLALVVLLAGLVLDGEGQSGRRASKPASSRTSTPGSPVVADNPSTEVEKTLARGELPAKVRLLVAREPTSRHLLSEDQIFASFVKQLNRYENIEATSVGDTKEGRAVERAKAESEGYVVLMKFDIDSFQSGTIIVNSQDLQIEYSVLAPRTGKRQTKGKIYFQGIGGGRMRKSEWPNGTPIRITPEAAGIEAADGLYFWLRLAAAKKAAQP